MALQRATEALRDYFSTNYETTDKTGCPFIFQTDGFYLFIFSQQIRQPPESRQYSLALNGWMAGKLFRSDNYHSLMGDVNNCLQKNKEIKQKKGQIHKV